eukprot:jgi/Tetstr1/462228/TSEL_000627.t1
MLQLLCQRFDLKETNRQKMKNKGKPATKQLLQGAGNTAMASAHYGSASQPKSTTRAPSNSPTRKSPSKKKATPPSKKKATGAAKSKQPPPADTMMKCGNSPLELAISPAPLEGRALSVDFTQHRLFWRHHGLQQRHPGAS